MKIKIVAIIDNFAPGGGAEGQLFLLAQGIDKARFDMSVCSLGDLSTGFAETLASLGVRSFSIPQHGFFDIRCVIGLVTTLGRLRPHIVQTALFTSDLYGRLAAVLQGSPAIVTSVRNIDMWKKGRHRVLDRMLEKRTSRFTANAVAIKEHLKRAYGIEDRKIAVIYNGIDSARFARRSPSRSLYGELGIEREKKVFLTIARFVPQKDHFTLIEAAKIVLRSRKDAAFVLISESGPLGSAIRDAIDRAGAKGSFKIVNYRDDVADFYNCAYASVLTSLYEGCSNFILESMACGLPVVATRVGGNPELVDDEKTGFLVAPRDPRAAAGKMLRLLDDPASARCFGEEARKKVESNFAVETMVRGYERLYELIYEECCATRE